MPNFALITITGHLGKDAELKSTASGTPILKFSVAVNTGIKEKKCSWYNCAMFGKQAEALAQYLTKGKAVTVAGEPSINKFTSDNGTQYTNVDVKVNQFAFAGGNDNSGNQSQEQSVPDDNDQIPF